MQTESRVEVTRGRGGGRSGEFVLNHHKATALGEENILERDRMKFAQHYECNSCN